MVNRASHRDTLGYCSRLFATIPPVDDPGTSRLAAAFSPNSAEVTHRRLSRAKRPSGKANTLFCYINIKL